jgi:predicted Rossmann fold nucleotide-binding protein DprA/Smf involved in DNA uptake
MPALRTLVTLTMTLRLDEASTKRLQPLEAREWTALARWLDGNGATPEDLLTDRGRTLLEERTPPIAIDRIHGLLERRDDVEMKLATWADAGIWALGRSDAAYPASLRKRLRDGAPPVLFGVGPHRLLALRGLALVGSRGATDAENATAARLGAFAAASGVNVVSGGARGIDQHSERGALEAEGTVVSVLADSLIRTLRKPNLASAIVRGDLVLLTPYSPEAGFSAGNAMGRNRLIYCLADAAIAVCSTRGRGGTFRGAQSALRNLATWQVPVWSMASNDPDSGHAALIGLGARELPPIDALTMETLTAMPGSALVTNQAALFHDVG